MVVVTNLNRRLKSPADKAVQEGKPIAQFITGPTRSAQDFQAPNPFLGKFKTNPRSDSFYQMFEDPEISQQDIDSRVGFYGNTFEGLNNQKAQEFLIRDVTRLVEWANKNGIEIELAEAMYEVLNMDLSHIKEEK